MNRWSWLASCTVMVAAVGHLVIVDLSVWILEASYVHLLPDSFLSQMKSAVIDWGLLGKNNVLNIFAGFSLWVPVSLFIIGLYNLFIFRHLPPGNRLRLQSLILGVSASAIFLVLSIVCLIYPPIIGSVLALVLFGLGIRKEKVLRQ